MYIIRKEVLLLLLKVIFNRNQLLTIMAFIEENILILKQKKQRIKHCFHLQIFMTINFVIWKQSQNMVEFVLVSFVFQVIMKHILSILKYYYYTGIKC